LKLLLAIRKNYRHCKIDGDSSLLRRQLFYIRATKLKKYDNDDLRKPLDKYAMRIISFQRDLLTTLNFQRKRIKIARP
jgi:hypothetical protein